MKQSMLNFPDDSEKTGEIKISSSPEDSHVNHSPSPGNNLEQKMTATSGRRCLELFERWGRGGSWAKTFAALLIGQGDWYSTRCRLIWKLKGTKSSRLWFQIAPSMLPIEEIGSGLLPTVLTQGMKECVNRKSVPINYALLPTPVSSDATTGAIIGKNDTYRETSTGMPRKINQNGTDGSVGLGRLVKLLKTPSAADAYTENMSKMEDGRIQRKLEKGWTIDLNDMAAMKLLPTPQATDSKGGATAESYEARGRDESNDLRTWAAFQERTGKTSQLNPRFVMEMMGFPPDWTELPFLNGDKSPSKPEETQ